MKKYLIIALLSVASFNSLADESKGVARSVGLMAVCALQVNKWSEQERIAVEFEAAMRRCRKIAYAEQEDYTAMSDREKERYERLFTFIELESLQRFREPR